MVKGAVDWSESQMLGTDGVGWFVTGFVETIWLRYLEHPSRLDGPAVAHHTDILDAGGFDLSHRHHDVDVACTPEARRAALCMLPDTVETDDTEFQLAGPVIQPVLHRA